MFKRFLAITASVVLLAGLVSCANDVSVSSTLTPASLSAPTVNGKVYAGVNYIQWLPVTNATQYALYRVCDTSAKLIKTIAYNATGSEKYEYFDIVTHENMLVDKKEYKYIVAAYGDQSKRAAAETSTTDFIMNADTILGDSQGSVTLTANIPAMYSQVDAATAFTATYNAEKSAIMFNYTLNDFMTAYAFAGKYLGTMTYAHKETGIDGIDIFDYFGASELSQVCAYGADYGAAYPGTYTAKLTTVWVGDTCSPKYYLDNTVTVDVTVPDAGENLPTIAVATAGDKGMKIDFTDKLGATYHLWKANRDSYEFTEVTATPVAKTTITTGVKTTAYTYYDKDVVPGEWYVYALTGTYKEAALNYVTDCVKTVQYTNTLAWTPQLAAFNNEGTVSLSWNVEDGVTYSLIRSQDFTDTTMGSYSETAIDTSTGTTVNGVFYMTDKITKLAKTGTYTYMLIGMNAAGAYNSTTDVVSYAEEDQYMKLSWTTPTTTNLTVTDTDKDGLADGVILSLTVDEDTTIAADKIVFYRATTDVDNVNTSISSTTKYEFSSAWAAVTLVKGATTTTGTRVVGTKTINTVTYTFTDNTLDEAKLAASDYAYAATYSDLSSIAVYNLCDTKADASKFNIKFTIAQNDDPSDKADSYTLAWNTQYYNFTTYDVDPTIAVQAGTLKAESAYSNEFVAANVTGWADDTASLKFTDATYTNGYTVKSDETHLYFWVKVTYTNKAGENNVFTTRVDNPAYVNVYEGIADAGTAIIHTAFDKTTLADTKDTYMYFTTTYGTSVTPAKANFTVYVTPVTYDGILGVPVVATISTVPVVTDATNVDLNSAYTDANNISYYFDQDTTMTDETVYPFLLIHVYDADGNVYRQMVYNW